MHSEMNNRDRTTRATECSRKVAVQIICEVLLHVGLASVSEAAAAAPPVVVLAAGATAEQHWQ